MKPIKIDLSADFKEIEIMPVADYHWADPNSDHDAIMKDIAYIRDNDNVFCVLNGDLLNCAIASSVSDVYARITPMEELRICAELFKPIAHKILCVVPGNHERRHYRTNGIDITELMCREIGIADRYSPTTALLFVRVGEQSGKFHGRKVPYVIHVSHGNGGGRKEGAKIQRLVELSLVVDADIYICGHSHLPALLPDRFFRSNANNSSVTQVERLYVNTSSKLQYSNSYGEVLGMKPNSTATPLITLCGTHKEFGGSITCRKKS